MAKKYQVWDAIGACHEITVDDGVTPILDKTDTNLLILGGNLFNKWTVVRLIEDTSKVEKLLKL